ncbi:MAG TPA: hypothetical protein VKF36_02880 [Syntrophorhabdales bacterium]|nr:hypothetical protein [Syntrophorhabdales bacterium]
MVKTYWLVIAVTITALSVSCMAFALDCPGVPVQATQDGQHKVSVAVGRIGPVKGVALEVRARSIANDLLRELPDADRVYLEQMMLSAYCTALRDDTSLAESEKAGRISTYREGAHKAIVNKGRSKTKVAKEDETRNYRIRREIEGLQREQATKKASIDKNLERMRDLNKDRATYEARCGTVDTIIDPPTRYLGEEPKSAVIQEEDIYSCQKNLELQSEVQFIKEKNALLQQDVETIDNQIADLRLKMYKVRGSL